MIRGLYSAASALEAASERQEVTAHNLSHASTPGYRGRGVAFETFDRALGRATPPAGEYVGTKLAGVYHDFRQGPVQQTGHPYDLALADPDTFFVVQPPGGTPLYTRNGSFHVDGRGDLVTQAGYAVLGEGGRSRSRPGPRRSSSPRTGPSRPTASRPAGCGWHGSRTRPG